MTTQIYFSKKINIFLQKRVKPQRYPFQERNQRAYKYMYNVLFFPKRKGIKHRFFKLPSFDCYESFQLCVYSIFCQTSHKTSLKFLLFSKKSQPQIICFEEKQLKNTIENVFVFLCKLFIREKKYF